MTGFRLAVVGVLICGVSAAAAQQSEQPSLADLAAAAAADDDDRAEASRVFTNDDLGPVARPPEASGPGTEPDAGTAPDGDAAPASDPSCTSEETADDATGNHFQVERCANGTVRVRASNPRTGARWQWTVFPNRSQEGTDSCGVKWTYDASTTEYRNTNGEVLVGEDLFRERLEAPTRCG